MTGWKPVLQGEAGLAGGGGDVLGLEEVGDDDDAAGSGGEDLGEVAAVDAADAEGGDSRADVSFHFGDLIEPDAGSAEFGGGGKQRAEADVVEALGEGGASLVERVGGAADDHRGADDGAGLGERAIVLPEVESVGAEFRGELGEVIEDEWDTGGAAEREGGFRDAADGGGVAGFGAELEQVRAAVEQGLGGGGGVFLADVAEVEDGVEAGVRWHGGEDLV